MPVTKDLQPNEFEITVVCPVGNCLVQHTYAYKIELKDIPGGIKEVKGRIAEMVLKAHKDGKHNVKG